MIKSIIDTQLNKLKSIHTLTWPSTSPNNNLINSSSIELFLAAATTSIANDKISSFFGLALLPSSRFLRD